MSRIARIVLKDLPYHVTQRGNGRQQVFFEDRDYRLYLDLLRTHCVQAGLLIWAYCLMPNHIHLIAVPQRLTALAQALGRTNAGFARYYNLTKGSCGHVWQARYYSTPMDTAHLWRAMAYIERNPVRAQLVTQADHYAWSSARLRCRAAQNAEYSPELLDLACWRAEYDWPRWSEVLRTSVDEEAFGRRLQEASRRGRPLGDDPFVDDLESRSGRQLRARPVGRPKRSGPPAENQWSLGHCA
jgi:putative transposase